MQPFHCCLTSLNKDIGTLTKTNKKEKYWEVFVAVVNIESTMVKKNIKFIIIGDQTPIVHIKPLLIFLFLF
jgi:hypothetical protein